MNIDEMIAYAESLSLQYTDGGYYEGPSSDSGANRNVVLSGGYAFKAMSRARYKDNVAEWDFYCSTTDEIRALLAKPVYISKNGNVIVMEALATRDVEYSKALAELNRLTQTAHGWHLYDTHGGNFGKRADGTVVCLDYGYVLFNVNQDLRFNVHAEYTKDIMAVALSK